MRTVPDSLRPTFDLRATAIGAGAVFVLATAPTTGHFRADSDVVVRGDAPDGFAAGEWESGGTVKLTIGVNHGTPLAAAPTEQWYYWTSTWQRNENIALRELTAGEFVEFDDVDEALAWLNEPEA